MAAATTIVMAAGAAVSAGSSFIQAHKQKKIQQKAERDADKMMKDARKKLEVNYMDELSLSMEPYERAREQNLVTAGAAMQAGVEGSERGGAATAGKVVQAGQKLEQDIQDKQIGAMEALEKASVEEDMALRDARVNLDLSEAQGHQTKAANAAATRQQAIQQGISSSMDLLGQGVKEFAPLYQKGAGNTDLSGLDYNQTFKGQQQPPPWSPGQDFKLNTTNLGTNNPNLFSQFNQQQQNQSPFMMGNQPYTGLNMFQPQSPWPSL